MDLEISKSAQDFGFPSPYLKKLLKDFDGSRQPPVKNLALAISEDFSSGNLHGGWPNLE